MPHLKGKKTMDGRRLRGQVVWVSGAASGMGEAVAELFAAEGAKVALVDVQSDRGQAVAARIVDRGGEAIFLQCDVASEDQVCMSLDHTVQEFGSLQTI